MNVFWASRAQIVMLPVAGPDAFWLLLELELSEPPHAAVPSARAAIAAKALIVLNRTALLLLLLVNNDPLRRSGSTRASRSGPGCPSGSTGRRSASPGATRRRRDGSHRARPPGWCGRRPGRSG